MKMSRAKTQSTQREEVSPNRETTIGQKASGLYADKFLFVVVSRQTKSNSLRPLRLCGERIFFCDDLRLIALNALRSVLSAMHFAPCALPLPVAPLD